MDLKLIEHTKNLIKHKWEIVNIDSILENIHEKKDSENNFSQFRSIKNLIKEIPSEIFCESKIEYIQDKEAIKYLLYYYLSLKKYRQAIRLINHADSIFKDDLNFIIHKVKILIKINKKDLALDILRLRLETNPGSIELIELEIELLISNKND